MEGGKVILHTSHMTSLCAHTPILNSLCDTVVLHSSDISSYSDNLLCCMLHANNPASAKFSGTLQSTGLLFLAGPAFKYPHVWGLCDCSPHACVGVT